MALLVLIATGVVLTQFFNPLPEEANASVRRIVGDVPLGELVRGVHFWAAQAMYVLAGAHLLGCSSPGRTSGPAKRTGSSGL